MFPPRPFGFLAALVALSITSLASRPRAISSRPTAQANLVGTWDGTCEPPGVVGGDPFSLTIASVDEAACRGELVLSEGVFPFEGVLGPARDTLVLEVVVGGETARVELRFRDETFTGRGVAGSSEYGFRAGRTSPEPLPRSHEPRIVALAGRELPETFSLEGLDLPIAFALDELMRRTMTEHEVVGLSLACVVGGKLADVRSLGWEDFFADVPASGATRYRWASISKPLTATTALRLASRGGFDLDADVRALVPEFPAKEVGGSAVTITPRHILCHQSGIVHYDGARRTWREYATPHPFEQLTAALDIFAESPLLFAPGTKYSYSTHAWTLLGLCMERAAKKRYAELVRELVLDPLAMKETEPDHPSRAIAHRSKGYERDAAGRRVECFEDDVSWKLPGGGWLSTVGDLARFGAGLIGADLLDEEMKSEAWTQKTLPGGEPTEVGFGFFFDELSGETVIQHSGGQRKASTYLAVIPARGLAVAVMSNTAGAPMEGLARAALKLLLDTVPDVTVAPDVPR